MKKPAEKHIVTTEDRRRRSRRTNLGLMAIAVAWVVIMLATHDTHFERWLGAIVLFLVGITGYFGIGTYRTRFGLKK
ncbi:MAG: hypothetical protein Q7V53_06700 [Caldisericota bacterium]|jgi:hypothetical protein|nr:hypothetical protein [Caldisericota bacterium]